MRYLIKYNEELKSDTYKSAADKLKTMCHVKRPDELMKWHVIVKEKEGEEKRRKAIEEASKLGIYKMTLNAPTSSPHSIWAGQNYSSFTGDFYVYFYLNDDNLDENYEDWKSFDNDSLWLTFDFAVLPASEESKEFAQNVLHKEIGRFDQFLYLGSFGLNLSEGGASYDENDKPTYVLKPNSGFYFEEHYSVGWCMADRASAQKFKKMLYDIFEGNIIWRETPDLPGGVKEEILDFICSDMGHDLEEFEQFIDSIKQISVNKIYND